MQLDPSVQLVSNLLVADARRVLVDQRGPDGAGPIGLRQLTYGLRPPPPVPS